MTVEQAFYSEESKAWALALSGPLSELGRVSTGTEVVAGIRRWKVSALTHSTLPGTVGVVVDGQFEVTMGLKVRIASDPMSDEEFFIATRVLTRVVQGVMAVDLDGYLVKCDELSKALLAGELGRFPLEQFVAALRASTPILPKPEQLRALADKFDHR